MNTVRMYLELAYYVSGILVAIAASIGLYQLYILKYDIRSRNQRASIELAFKFIERTHNILVPDYNQWFKSITEHKIPRFELPLEKKPPSNPPVNRARLKHAMDNLELIHRMFNELEYLAIGILSGACDEDLIFNTIGTMYHDTIVSFYDIMRPMAMHNPDLIYNNALMLFERWRKRLLRQKLLREREKIAADLKDTSQSEIAKLGTRP